MRRAKKLVGTDSVYVPSTSPFYGEKAETPQEIRDLKKKIRKFEKGINHKLLMKIPLTDEEKVYVEGVERHRIDRPGYGTQDSLPKRNF